MISEVPSTMGSGWEKPQLSAWRPQEKIGEVQMGGVRDGTPP